MKDKKSMADRKTDEWIDRWTKKKWTDGQKQKERITDGNIN